MYPHQPKNRTIVFIDTETTGLHEGSHRIIEIGVIVTKMLSNGFTHDDVIERNSLINPCMPIPSRATHVNHITDVMVGDKPLFSDVIDAVMAMIPKKSILVAHNAPFDMKFLANECARHSEQACEWILSMDVIDTLKPYRKNFKGKANLASMCAFFNVHVPASGTHRAIVDARMLMRCYNEWTRKYSPLMMMPELTPVPIREIISIDILSKRNNHQSQHQNIQYTDPLSRSVYPNL